MADLGSTDLMDVGVALGSTWHTAADFSSAGDLIHCRMGLNAGYGLFTPRDNGFNNFRGSITRLAKNVGVQITCDLAYDQAWMMLLFAFLGQSTASPSENNVGEGDYAHTGAMAEETGKFVTLGWLIEDDEAVEIPSAIVQSISIQSDVNGVGTFQANLIADQIVGPGSVTNSVADIQGLSYPTFEAAVFGDTNHYLRIDDYSTSGSLSSADDQEILSYTLNLSRPLPAKFSLRGANSKYTDLPKQLGPASGSLAFQLAQNDSSDFDAIDEFLTETVKMAEIFFDGSQIESGDNRSVKLQMPSMEIITLPSELAPQSNNQLIQPTVTLEMVQAAAAASGMSGFTSYLNAEIVGTRSATWVGAA